MANKEQGKGDGISPLMFLAGAFETIAVVAFLAVIFERSRGPMGNEVAAFELIGILVLFAWFIKKIDKVVQVAVGILDRLLDKFIRFLTNTAPAGSTIYTPIEIEKLGTWHMLNFRASQVIILVVALPLVVILAMYTLAEGSPVTATVWKWTYVSTVSIMGICLAWMIGTVFHASRRRRAKNGGDGPKHGE